MNLQRGSISGVGGGGGNSFSREFQIITSYVYWERTPGLHGKCSPANPGVTLTTITWCPLATGLILGFRKPHLNTSEFGAFVKRQATKALPFRPEEQPEGERGAMASPSPTPFTLTAFLLL